MSGPRVIVVEGCKGCRYVHDWSSGGLVCRHPEHDNRVITPGLSPREPWKVKSPDWCPLPIATGIDFGHAICTQREKP